jgi:hypothetical protein
MSLSTYWKVGCPFRNFMRGIGLGEGLSQVAVVLYAVVVFLGGQARRLNSVPG